MANTNPNQLFLLADHIKLSLLERQRAISLNLEPNAQDGHISRSLESFREGVESLEQDPDITTSQDTTARLRTQYDDLTSQFRGFADSMSSTTRQPNDPSLSDDFAHATTKPSSTSPSSRPSNPTSSSFLKRSANNNSTSSPNPNKSVRFRDTSPSSGSNPANTRNGNYVDNDEEDEEDAANRAALFPYRDNPPPSSDYPQPPDQTDLSNQQIHTYHSQVLRDQDDQLDRLGASIGRQRDLSIQIGDELDDQVQMLDEVEGHMDRHQGRLDGARKRLGDVARKAKDNKSISIIVVLIIVLVFLIVILK